MKAKWGMFFMALGILCIVGAAGLLAYNIHSEEVAGAAVRVSLPEVKAAAHIDESGEVEVKTVDDTPYIGYLSLEKLGLELPARADFSMEALMLAPCRYSGSIEDNNLVLAAHNFRQHFGAIDRLVPGDEVRFTDMNGNTSYFQVKELVTLAPNQVEEMIDGGAPLTLFTCNYSGNARLTVRFSGHWQQTPPEAY